MSGFFFRFHIIWSHSIERERQFSSSSMHFLIKMITITEMLINMDELSKCTNRKDSLSDIFWKTELRQWFCDGY